MAEIVNTATIKVIADASGVEAGLRPVSEAARRAGDAVAGVGNGASASARNVESAARSMAASIQRTTAAMEAGGRQTSAYYEVLGRQRGVDPATLAPFLAQLRAVEEAQARAAKAASDQDAAQRQAADSARVQAAAQRELAQAQATRDNFIAGLREEIALFGRSTEEVLRYRAAQAGASQESAQLILQLQNMRAAQAEVTREARAQAEAQRAAAQVQAGRDSFIASLQQQAEAIGKTRTELLELRAAQLGVTNDVAPYIEKLKEAEKAQSGASSHLNEFGVSAGQTTAALRQLPAQITDIVTQLAGGQNPFMIMIQQGGQIKDSFGGAGNAIDAIGGQVKSLFTSLVGGAQAVDGIGNALSDVGDQQGSLAQTAGDAAAGVNEVADAAGTLSEAGGTARNALSGVQLATGLVIGGAVVAAAALGALAYAHYKGSLEAGIYTRALIMSGNAAGATVDQLSEASRQIAVLSGSRGAAMEAVNALVATGQVSADMLKEYGSLAVDVQKVVGRSVQETADDFASLGESPLEALDKVDKKYHIITASTYLQVKALQDQGKASEAADLAQQAYADGIQKQRQQVLDSLTDWERGWIRIKGAVSGAIDAVIDFAAGREATSVEKINSLLGEREAIETRLASLRRRGAAREGGSYDPNKDPAVASAKAELDANERSINVIRDKEKAQRDAAKAKAESQKIDDAQKQWAKDADQFLGRVKQRENEIAVAREQGAAAHLKSKDIEDRVAAIRVKYADTYNSLIESNIAALKRQDQVADAIAQRELARIAAQQALGSITEESAINKTAEVELRNIDRDIASAQQELAQIQRKVSAAPAQKTIEINDKEAELAKLREERAGREERRQNDLLILDQKRAQASDDLFNKGVQAAAAERENLLDQVKAQREANEAIGLSGEALADLVAMRLEATAASRDQTAASIEEIQPGNETARIYREQAEALRELASEKRSGAAKQAVVDTAKKAEEEWKRTSEQIGQSLTDNLMRGGKSAADYLKDLFRTLVLRPILSPIGNFVGASLTSAIGLPGTAAAAPGDVSGASSAISAAQVATNAYKAISGGFETLSTSVADAVQAGLYESGLSSNIASNGAFANGAGAAAGYLGGAAVGVYGGRALSSGYAISGSGNGLVNVGTIAGAIVGGPIGAAIGGLIGGAANRLFGRKAPEIESQGIRGAYNGSGNLTGQSYQNIVEKGGVFRSDKRYDDVKVLADQMQSQLGQAFLAITDSSTTFAKSLGLGADSLANYSKLFDIKLTGDAAKGQQAIEAFFGGVADEVAGKLVPNLASFSQTGEAASATLQRLAGEFDATTIAAQNIGKTAEQLFGSIGLSSAAARERLVQLAGGTGALTSLTGSYAQNYLSEAERLAPVTKALDEALGKLGLSSIPTTRDEFKKLVDGFDLTNEAQAKQFVSLMQLGDAFALVHPATEDTADAAKKAAEALAEVNKGYQSQIDDLLKASLPAAEVRAMEIAGMDASTVALYDRLAALKGEAAAASERKDLQAQLDQLVLSSAELLIKQRDALDASNQSLFDQIQLAQRAKTVADERKGLQDQLDEVTMSSAQLLAKQRAALDASNQSLFDQIQAVKQQKEATDKAAEASAAYVRSLGDAFMDSISRAKEAAKALREFNDSLKLGDLSALDPDARYREAKKQFQASDSGDTKAMQAFLQASKDRGADSFYYERDFAAVQAKLADGIAKADARPAALAGLYQDMAGWMAPKTSPSIIQPGTPPIVTMMQGSMTKSSAQQADISRVEAKVDGLLEKLGDNMEVIADSTARTAKYIGRVTGKGTGMEMA